MIPSFFHMSCKTTVKHGDQEVSHTAPKDMEGTEKSFSFVHRYYEKQELSPESLYRLYYKKCEVSWRIDKDSQYNMNSPKEIMDFMIGPHKLQGKFYPKSDVVHRNTHKKSLHVVCQGVFKVDNMSSSFVQSFVLHHRRELILSDVLRIVPFVPRIKRYPSCSACAAAMAAKDLPKDVIVVYNAACLLHIPPSHNPNPEKPQRIKDILASFERDGVFQRVLFEGSDPAEREHILAVHEADYLDFIDGLPASAHDPKFSRYVDSDDMYASPGTKDAVYLAAGAVIKACDSVAGGRVKKAFALVRPPGHHALPDFAQGYCYLNHAAIAAKYLKEKYGKEKVLIVDIDVHQADGTQFIFYESDSTMLFSTHSNTLGYPKQSNDGNRSMKHTSIGDGNGYGFNINIPMRSGYGDSDVLYAIDNVLFPLVKAFKPDSIVVSAGFDAAAGDEVGKCKVSKKGYGTMAHKFVELGNGSVVMCLEGGYGSVALGDCVSYCVRSLYGDPQVRHTQEELYALGPPSQYTIDNVRKVKKLLMKRWPEEMRIHPPILAPMAPGRPRRVPSIPPS